MSLYLLQRPTLWLIVMKIGTLKEEEDRLKSDIIVDLESQFIDQFEKWKIRQNLFNEVVLRYNEVFNSRLKEMSYDEFCQFFIRGSKSVLNEHIRMDNIVPSPIDIEGIKSVMVDQDDADDFKRRYTAVLQAKSAHVRMKIAKAWNEQVFRYMVSKRYGSKRYLDILAVKREIVDRLN